MPRPRTPKSVAEVTGADVLHPGRHAARKEPKVPPLGRAPARLTEVERRAWEEMADEMPWLARSDRTLVEVAAKLRARMMTDPDMGVNALAQLRLCLSSMGATPVDRTKVSVTDEESDDPADQFLN